MDVEGFVIRCKKGDEERGPYQDWFFKYKFEEPYLMYRQWREVTKAIISGKVPKYKKHVKITAEYLNYARRQLAENRNLGKAFNQNHGIIAMRNGFLAEKGLKGSDIIRLEEEEEKNAPRNVTKDVFLVPIATLGCGKTTIAKALEKLLGWAHIQNDDVQGKRGRPAQFVSLIFSASAASPVVFADRNNAERRERAQIIDDLTAMIPDASFVALYWDHDEEGTMRRQEVRHVLRSRVMGRGDNHQTIQAATKDEQHITGIMENFMRRFQPVNPYEEPDSGFDSVITLDPTAESRGNLQTVVTQLHGTYPGLFKEMPSSDDLDDAIDYALHDYRPDLRHSVGPSQKKNGNANGQAEVTPKGKVRKVSYFAIKLPSTPILEALRCCFPSPEDPTARFYMYLRQMRRMQAAFHVTLIHKAQASAFPEQWSRYSALHKQALEASDKTDTADPELGICKVQLERVVWDDRVMCVVARLVDAEDGWETINRVAHITIGTAEDSIKPKESNALLERWMAGEKGINDLLIKGSPLVEGSVRAVLQ
ncbi:MAG: hypothetical protein M1824_002460 [Vezdaea acicularis]|nr:MAG: hypothetical protein M1824_002460 [Vezdaea acicularis]